jgi:hypothetical protein
MFFALDHARAGDKKKIARANAHIADLEVTRQDSPEIISPRSHKSTEKPTLVFFPSLRDSVLG